jgi:spore germination protein KB
MSGRINLRGRQFFILVTLYMIGSAVLIMPSVLSAEAKQDAWISAILVILAGLGFTWIVYKVYQRFPGKNLVEMTTEVMGRRIGTIVCFLFFFSFVFFTTALTLRNLGDFVVTVMLPNTPISVIELLFLFVVIMAVRHGLMISTYTAEIFFPWVFLLFLILGLALISEVKWAFIQPIFDVGFKTIIRAAIPHMGFPYMESVLFLMITCHVQEKGKVGRMWFMAITVSGLFMLLLTLLTILVIGPAQAALSIYPSFELAKYIQFGRLEFFMTFIWFVTVFVRLILLYYIMLAGLAATFKWRDTNFFSFPLSIFVLIGSILFVPNPGYLYELIPVWVNFAFIWGVGFPILLLILPKLRK